VNRALVKEIQMSDHFQESLENKYIVLDIFKFIKFDFILFYLSVISNV
jgi:hypothetical protein